MTKRPAYPRLAPKEKGALLARVVLRCVRQPGRAPPVVVFDLDGTLMDNRPRTCAILHEVGASWRSREPVVAAQLLALRPEQLHYHFRDSLEELGITKEELVTELDEFWKLHFFADAHLRHDVEVPGASAFARACYDAGATLIYLTGRDLPLMGLGTFGSLRDLKFPIGVPGTELVLKPDAAIPDTEWKRDEATKLARVGDVVASFDNEPENCNLMLAEFGDADSVFVDTQHIATAPPLDPCVSVLADFLT